MMKERQENVWGGKMKEKKLKEKQKARLFSCENKERFAFPQQKKDFEVKAKTRKFLNQMMFEYLFSSTTQNGKTQHSGRSKHTKYRLYHNYMWFHIHTHLCL